jgi:hypothetical protein
MKDKIKQRFRDKFKTLALSNQRLDAIADKLSPKLPEDADDAAIDAELDFLNDVYPFLEIQKADDRAVSEKQKTQQQQQQQTTPSSTSTQQQTDDTPAWAKALLEKVNALEQEKTQGTIKQQLKEKLKDIPEVFYKHAALPASIDELDAFADVIKTDYTAFKQENINAQAGGNVPVGTQSTKAVVDDIKAWAEKNNPKP